MRRRHVYCILYIRRYIVPVAPVVRLPLARMAVPAPAHQPDRMCPRGESRQFRHRRPVFCVRMVGFYPPSIRRACEAHTLLPSDLAQISALPPPPHASLAHFPPLLDIPRVSHRQRVAEPGLPVDPDLHLSASPSDEQAPRAIPWHEVCCVSPAKPPHGYHAPAALQWWQWRQSRRS